MDIVPDENGDWSYCLCFQQRRHYTVKFKRGQPHRLSAGYKPCDRVSCFNGQLVEDTSPSLLCALGIYTRLRNDEVLVISGGVLATNNTYKIVFGGSIVSPEDLQRGALLANSKSIRVERVLDQPIDLSPGERDPNKRELVCIITDTIRNDNGRAVVTNNEAELRARAAELLMKFQDEYHKAEDQRQARRKDFAREVGQFLFRECGFTRDQVTMLFQIAGPGQCREAVDLAREALSVGVKAEDFCRHIWGWNNLQSRARAGAHYILEIGGVPCDRGKNRKTEDEY